MDEKLNEIKRRSFLQWTGMGLLGTALNPVAHAFSEEVQDPFTASMRSGLVSPAKTGFAEAGVPSPSRDTGVVSVAPRLLQQLWSASWISSAHAPERGFGVYFFRKTLDLQQAPGKFVIHASGDNRYQLYVNGVRVLLGPAKGDLFHWRFETLDIAPQLHPGKNVLAAVVWNFAGQAPMAQMTNETGFLLQGDGDAEIASTNHTWKVLDSRAFEMIAVGDQTHHVYTVVGPGERIDGSRYPWDWQQASFDDSSWRPAVELTRAGPRAIQDTPSRWMLVPRNIPLVESSVKRLERVRRYSGPAGFHPADAFLAGTAPVQIPAHSEATMLLDQGYETTVYPELVTSGGQGATITLTYAEALFDAHHDKGNRDDITGKHIEGYRDEFLPDGGAHHLFRPLWWRTYRYLQIRVKTGAEPVTLDDYRGEFTAYPFVRRAHFTSNDPTLEKIMDVGWRTAQLCAHETYMDCPYYEQLQYVGDTRIEALISYYMTGDDRLARNAIELLNDSRTPEGLTQSRYPSFLPQYIPPFSLYWIGMLHDFWWYRGDVEFLRPYLVNMHGVLAWYQARLLPSGLLGKLPWWDFVDWTPQWEGGVPSQESDGQSSILSLELAAALKEAADLEAAYGSHAAALEDQTLAHRICQAVYRSCWDGSRGLLADTPAKKNFSQHANILGVLTDTIPAARQRPTMQKVLDDNSLVQSSYYFKFYLFRAMEKVGLGSELIPQLQPWQHMLELGLTTFAEKPEPTRSDCHAWSAHPTFDLLAMAAGIEPASAGFSKVAIRPNPGPLSELQASMPIPQGTITVHYHHDHNHLSAEVSLPPGVSGSFYWGGQRRLLHPGPQSLSM